MLFWDEEQRVFVFGQIFQQKVSFPVFVYRKWSHIVTHGMDLGYKFASQQPSQIRSSSSHHVLERDWCRFLNGFVVLLHKWRYILTSQTNWCNCRQLLERKIKNSVQNQWLSKESTHDL